MEEPLAETEGKRPAQKRPPQGKQSNWKRLLAGIGDRIKKIGRKKNEHTVAPRATQVVNRTLREADHPPDPETTLRNAARATTILGKMLEDIADKSAKRASKAIRLITNVGLLGYGLIEISVPRSIWSHIASYWLQLVTLIGAAMFTIGLVFRSQDTWKIGLGVLVIAWLTSGLRDVLKLVMRRRRFTGWALAIQWRLLLLLACLAVLAVVNAQTFNRVLSETGGVLIWLQKEVLNGWQTFLDLLSSMRGHKQN